jgi:hypothetical protein
MNTVIIGAFVLLGAQKVIIKKKQLKYCRGPSKEKY